MQQLCKTNKAVARGMGGDAMILIFSFASELDRDKFEFIYSRYKNLILHKAYGILRDYALAEDAASETFIRIYKNLDKIIDPSSNQSAAFIMTIAKNCALTLLEKEKKAAPVEMDETLSDGFDLEQHILSELSSQEIYAALDQLGEEQKSIFLFKFAYGMSHRDIGKLLDLTENNVTVKLHRAKKQLAQLLVKEGYV